MIPKGFLFSTVEAAIKKPGRKDLALIYSQTEANTAGKFTLNKVKAAPVKLDMKKIRTGRGQAIIVNSGNANACTGQKGVEDAVEMTRLVAHQLKMKPSLVYVCSTGVIGTPMPMDRITAKIPGLMDNLGKSAIEDVAAAIMTTDTFPKILRKKAASPRTTSGTTTSQRRTNTSRTPTVGVSDRTYVGFRAPPSPTPGIRGGRLASAARATPTLASPQRHRTFSGEGPSRRSADVQRRQADRRPLQGADPGDPESPGRGYGALQEAHRLCERAHVRPRRQHGASRGQGVPLTPRDVELSAEERARAIERGGFFNQA